MDKQEAEVLQKIFESLKKMHYYGEEIAELLQFGFSRADLDKIEKLMEDHKTSRIDELEYHMKILKNPKLQRLGILLKGYIEAAHCPVCATIFIVAAFMAKLILDNQGQTLQ
jgi:hypothetical protein